MLYFQIKLIPTNEHVLNSMIDAWWVFYILKFCVMWQEIYSRAIFKEKDWGLGEFFLCISIVFS